MADKLSNTLSDHIATLNTKIAGLNMMEITINDSFVNGSNTSNGVSLSDLTGGVITLSTQVKGLALFNTTASIYQQLQYQNKIVFARDGTSGAVSISMKAILFY